MRIPKVMWYSIGVICIILTCGFVARVSKSSVSVEVGNKYIKTQIKLQRAASLVENATSTVQAVIDDALFLGTQTLSIEKIGGESSVNVIESLEIKKKELEKIIKSLEEAQKGLQNIKF